MYDYRFLTPFNHLLIPPLNGWIRGLFGLAQPDTSSPWYVLGDWAGFGISIALDGYNIITALGAGSLRAGVCRILGNQFCFVAGTLVETADGPMPIEQIEVGMWVRATDPNAAATGATEQEEDAGFDWNYIWAAAGVVVATCVLVHRRNRERRGLDALDELLDQGLATNTE